jgi:spermidine/putrescine-binding protein
MVQNCKKRHVTKAKQKEEKMVHRSNIVRICALSAFGLLAFMSAPLAQEKAAKDLVVGNWTLIIADHVRADGTKMPGFGPLPSGTATFGADGRYSLQIKRNPPASAPNVTVGAGQSAAQDAVSLSGTYAIDDSQKALTIKFDQSSLPGWGGTTQKDAIKFLVGDDFGWITQKPLTSGSDFVSTELIWRRAK